MSPNPLRNLPTIHDLLESPPLKGLVKRISHNALVITVRTVMDEVRREVQTAAADRTLPSVSDLAERIAQRIAEEQSPTLRPVVNATGRLLDERLGRVPLADEAIVEMAAIGRDYANLELNLVDGESARRDVVVEGLLRELSGAEAALVVNNNAGATLLTLAALAAGREVIVSRGQVIDLGGGYRLPEMMTASGAVLREVGTTNKTQLDDYAQAIGESTAAMMLVHLTGRVMVGAAESATLAELVGLGQRRHLPVIHNVGYGAMIDFGELGLARQPMVQDSIKAGADVVLLSGDKLLGGPQCGIILGRRFLLEKIDRHPLARALRVDKLTLAALAATLRPYRDPIQARLGIPLLRLLTTSTENLQNRAERLAPQASAASAVAEAVAMADVASVGWGALAAQEVPTWCIAIRPKTMTVERLAEALRQGTPSVIGRVKGDQLLLDLRSVMPRQDVQLIAALETLDQPTDAAGQQP